MLLIFINNLTKNSPCYLSPLIALLLLIVTSQTYAQNANVPAIVVIDAKITCDSNSKNITCPRYRKSTFDSALREIQKLNSNPNSQIFFIGLATGGDINNRYQLHSSAIECYLGSERQNCENSERQYIGNKGVFIYQQPSLNQKGNNSSYNTKFHFRKFSFETSYNDMIVENKYIRTSKHPFDYSSSATNAEYACVSSDTSNSCARQGIHIHQQLKYILPSLINALNINTSDNSLNAFDLYVISDLALSGGEGEATQLVTEINNRLGEYAHKIKGELIPFTLDPDAITTDRIREYGKNYAKIVKWSFQPKGFKHSYQYNAQGLNIIVQQVPDVYTNNKITFNVNGHTHEFDCLRDNDDNSKLICAISVNELKEFKKNNGYHYTLTAKAEEKAKAEDEKIKTITQKNKTVDIIGATRITLTNKQQSKQNSNKISVSTSIVPSTIHNQRDSEESYQVYASKNNDNANPINEATCVQNGKNVTCDLPQDLTRGSYILKYGNLTVATIDNAIIDWKKYFSFPYTNTAENYRFLADSYFSSKNPVLCLKTAINTIKKVDYSSTSAWLEYPIENGEYTIVSDSPNTAPCTNKQTTLASFTVTLALWQQYCHILIITLLILIISFCAWYKYKTDRQEKKKINDAVKWLTTPPTIKLNENNE